MTPVKIEIPYNGQSFFIDIAEGKMVNLNRIFEISGASSGKEPKEWNKLESTKKLIKSIEGGKSPIVKTVRGGKNGGGGTWAHWQLALSYAQYLSAELHLAVNQVFKERLEETIDPELGISRSRERAIKAWRKQGKDDKFIQTRIKGIDARNVFTGTLSEHGVVGMGYANCTNNIYTPILGGKAADIKKQKGLSKSENLRDSMSTVELAGVMFAEILASDKIEREDRQGNNSCASACLGAAMNIKTVIDKHETSLEKPAEKQVTTSSSLSQRLDRLNALRQQLA